MAVFLIIPALVCFFFFHRRFVFIVICSLPCHIIIHLLVRPIIVITYIHIYDSNAFQGFPSFDIRGACYTESNVGRCSATVYRI